MRRMLRGILLWGLAGVAAGAYFMARADGRTRRAMRGRARRMGRVLQRTAQWAAEGGGPRLRQAMEGGRRLARDAVRMLRRG